MKGSSGLLTCRVVVHRYSQMRARWAKGLIANTNKLILAYVPLRPNNLFIAVDVIETDAIRGNATMVTVNNLV